MIEAVIDGRIAITTDDASYLQGEMAVDVLYDYWSGEKVEEYTEVPSTNISQDNIEEFKAMYDIK